MASTGARGSRAQSSKASAAMGSKASAAMGSRASAAAGSKASAAMGSRASAAMGSRASAAAGSKAGSSAPASSVGGTSEVSRFSSVRSSRGSSEDEEDKKCCEEFKEELKRKAREELLKSRLKKKPHKSSKPKEESKDPATLDRLCCWGCLTCCFNRKQFKEEMEKESRKLELKREKKRRKLAREAKRTRQKMLKMLKAEMDEEALQDEDLEPQFDFLKAIGVTPDSFSGAGNAQIAHLLTTLGKGPICTRDPTIDEYEAPGAEPCEEPQCKYNRPSRRGRPPLREVDSTARTPEKCQTPYGETTCPRKTRVHPGYLPDRNR